MGVNPTNDAGFHGGGANTVDVLCILDENLAEIR